jgi:hypothetical protein
VIRLQSSGWQATMIDLSLILFLLTSAALSQAGPGQKGAAAPVDADGDNASALYNAGPDAPDFPEWLAEQQPDPRQRLTIHALYRPGEEKAAFAIAMQLLAQAGPAAANARVVAEPSARPRVYAELGYDLPPRQLARSLQNQPTATPVGSKP